MKVLFVRSGNKGPDPISTRQAESLQKLGIRVSFYDIIGKGVLGYLKNLYALKRRIKMESPDLIHAHYSLSGYLTSLTGTTTRIVTSLMGSDVLSTSQLNAKILRYFANNKWAFTIVKSKQLLDKLSIKKCAVIPNGVNLEEFYEIDRISACNKLGWDANKRNILFGADPLRPEKNFQLANAAIQILEKEFPSLKVHYLKDVDRLEVYLYYSASELILLTSTHEGSPNVIKEALACNCPIVSVDVGDVKELITGLDGCYVVDRSPTEIAAAAKRIFEKSLRTKGRARILELQLDSENIAKKLIKVYSELK